MKAISVNDFGLRVGHDGKMRLSMDPRAYHGPRIGDFVAEAFNEREHMRFANMTEQEALFIQQRANSKTVSDESMRERGRREQLRAKKKQRDMHHDKKQNFCSSGCIKAVVRLQGKPSPDGSPSSGDAKNNSAQSRKLRGKPERKHFKQRITSSRRRENSMSRPNESRLMRPHRALMVHSVSNKTDRSRSQVLKAMLDLQGQICNPDREIMNSLRSTRSCQRAMSRPETSLPMSSPHRRLLHEKLKRSSTQTKAQESLISSGSQSRFGSRSMRRSLHKIVISPHLPKRKLIATPTIKQTRRLDTSSGPLSPL